MDFQHFMPHFPGGPIRTTGDGRENPDGAEDPAILANKLSAFSIGVKQLEPPPEDLSKLSFSPVKPVGEIIYLTPKLARDSPRSNAESSFRSLQGKEPKFVPYEPYKGAVHPIVARKSQKKLKRNASSDCVIIKELQVPQEVEMLSRDDETQTEIELRAELSWAKKEIEAYATKLQFQEKVNAELKSMLVAAVGEDVEVKVHHLTEDKLHLARALVSNSVSMTCDREKLEDVAGQCEVWRSKFLASSLMVEELGRWKMELVQMTHQLQESLGEILSENSSAKESMKKTLGNLQLLRENFDPAAGMSMGSPSRKLSAVHCPPTSTLADIASANFKLSQSLGQRLLGYIPPQTREPILGGLPSHSPAEWKALTLLKSSASSKFGLSPDEACNAVVGAAAAIGCQLFPKVSCTPTACCGQCSGEIHQL